MSPSDDGADPDTRTRAAHLRELTLEQLDRISWGSVLQVVMLVFAASAVIKVATRIDLDELLDALAGTRWWLAAIALLTTQTPRLAQTASTLGAAPQPIDWKPVYLLQLAQSYMALAVPSSAARIAMSIRFFQRQGFEAGAALAMGAVDGFAGFIVEATTLAVLVFIAPTTLHLDLDAPSLPEWGTVLAWLAGLGVVILIISAAFPQRRARLTRWFRKLISDGRVTLQGLRSPRRLVLLFGGNLASTLLFATGLGLFTRAVGTRVGFSDLVLIVIAVSLLAGLLPIPGGIGVVEGGLTFGLVAIGMDEQAAFAAVVLYRLASFYLPPIWGLFAFRYLERSGYL